MQTPLTAMVMATVALCGCNLVTGPDEYGDQRTGILFVVASCSGDGASPLTCAVRTTCTGYCTGAQNASLGDVSAGAEWLVEGSAVRQLGSGRFEAVGVGYAGVSARVPGYFGESGQVFVGVFPGLQPVPVFMAVGRVGYGQYVTGPLGTLPRIDRPLDGVTVEVVDGPAAGLRAVSGQPSAPLGGLRWPEQPGAFFLAGLPNGPFEIDVRVPGKPSMRVSVPGPNATAIILVPE